MNISASIAIHGDTDLPRLEVTKRNTLRIWYGPESFIFTASDVNAAEWARNHAAQLNAVAATLESGEQPC